MESMHISFHAGNATRFCDNRGQWGQANVLNCTSPEFTELEVLVSVSMAVDVAPLCMHIFMQECDN